MKYTVNEKGYYGKFGGAFIPEMLYPNVEELRTKYLDIITSAEYKKALHKLLKDYVGRPTPLYLAKRLSEIYKATIYLKREDLCHTGSHKINNTIGQILLAQRLGKQKIIAETGAGQHGGQDSDERTDERELAWKTACDHALPRLAMDGQGARSRHRGDGRDFPCAERRIPVGSEAAAVAIGLEDRQDGRR